MALKFSKGWKRFIRAMSGRRPRRVADQEVQRKVREQLELLRRDIVAYIDSEKHGVSNSPLTILIKGSARPLVDHGDLRASINTAITVRGTTVEGGVGVLRRKSARGGKKMWNIAVALHEGFTVKVTPAVRAAVFAEMRRRRRGKKVRFEGGGGGVKTWKVKGRPFVKDPFEEAIPRIKVALGDAVTVTLQKL